MKITLKDVARITIEVALDELGVTDTEENVSTFADNTLILVSEELGTEVTEDTPPSPELIVAVGTAIRRVIDSMRG